MVLEEKMIMNGEPDDEEEEEEDEEDLVDPLETLRQKCEETEHCMHTKERLELCETRVSSRSQTEEECTEELFDFLHARDHCIISGDEGGEAESFYQNEILPPLNKVSHKLFHSVK